MAQNINVKICVHVITWYSFTLNIWNDFQFTIKWILNIMIIDTMSLKKNSQPERQLSHNYLFKRYSIIYSQ